MMAFMIVVVMVSLMIVAAAGTSLAVIVLMSMIFMACLLYTSQAHGYKYRQIVAQLLFVQDDRILLNHPSGLQLPYPLNDS